ARRARRPTKRLNGRWSEALAHRCRRVPPAAAYDRAMEGLEVRAPCPAGPTFGPAPRAASAASSGRVGLVAPLPPQIGGAATVAAWLLEHEAEIGCRYETFDLWRPADGQ